MSTAAPSYADPDFALTVADNLAPPRSPHYNDPAGWADEKLGWNDPHAPDGRWSGLWSKQAEVAQSVNDNRYTATRSCHGAGKSYDAAVIACWWLDTREDAIVVSSAPSSNQVKNILWKEIRRVKERADMPGYITLADVPEWKLPNGEVIAFGRKPADYVDPDEAATAFQGIHAKHVLVILDEGSGIPDWLATAAESLITNEHSRLLIIGNPTNPASYFARMSQPASGYNKIKISAWDLPAYTGEYVPTDVADVLTGKLWVEERRQRWGEGSMFWIGKVEAEFPTVAEDVLFTPAVLALGINTDLSRYAATKQKGTGGMDVARMGEDETVIYVNQKGYVRIKDRWGKMDLEDTVDRYCSLWPLTNPGASPTMSIDVTGGLGAGPHDRLKRLGYPVVEFNFGSKAYNNHKFKNRRAEAYYEAKQAMEEERVDIDALDEELQRELMEHRFKTNSTGLIQIEAKEEVAKRLGRSPDRADAFVMALQRTADWAKVLGVEDDHQGAVVTGRASNREPSAEEIVQDSMEVKF